MLDVGLWIQSSTGEQEEVFLIKKDQAGHPLFSVIRSCNALENPEAQKAKLRQLYEQLTDHAHPHPYATSRQLMWDFLEAAIKKLP